MGGNEVDGVDYTPKGILELRSEIIQLRNDQVVKWPEGIDASVKLSHAIVLLARLAEIIDNKVTWTAIGIGNGHPSQRVMRSEKMDPILAASDWLNYQEMVIGLTICNGEVTKSTVLKSRDGNVQH